MKVQAKAKAEVEADGAERHPYLRRAPTVTKLSTSFATGENEEVDRRAEPELGVPRDVCPARGRDGTDTRSDPTPELQDQAAPRYAIFPSGQALA